MMKQLMEQPDMGGEEYYEEAAQEAPPQPDLPPAQ